MEGMVELDFLIDENGSVQDIQVVESSGAVFDSAVVETVRNWKYQPATKNGVRVKMRWVQRFRFQQGR
jgi:protein TonB